MECMSNIENEVVQSVSLSSDLNSVECNHYLNSISNSYSTPFLSPFNYNRCEPYPTITTESGSKNNTPLEEFSGNIYYNPQEYFSTPYLQKKYSFLALNKEDYQNDWTYYWNQSFIGAEAGDIADNQDFSETVHHEDIFIEDIGEGNVSSDDSRG